MTDYLFEKYNFQNKHLNTTLVFISLIKHFHVMGLEIVTSSQQASCLT